MRPRHLGAIRAAKRAVDLVLSEDELDKNHVPYFEPTNIGGLPGALQRKERETREENDQGNRVRAASHLCLQSASEALAVVLEIGELSVDEAFAARAKRLENASAQMRMAAALGSESAAVFAGNSDPRSDGSVSITKGRSE